jgi:hypothetical protein
MALSLHHAACFLTLVICCLLCHAWCKSLPPSSHSHGCLPFTSLLDFQRRYLHLIYKSGVNSAFTCYDPMIFSKHLSQAELSRRPLESVTLCPPPSIKRLPLRSMILRFLHIRRNPTKKEKISRLFYLNLFLIPRVHQHAEVKMSSPKR